MKKTLTFKNGEFVLYNADKCASLTIKAALCFRQWADDKAKKIINRILVKQYPAPAEAPPPCADPHQREGIRWILTRSRSYLAHAPGAGKTFQAIIAAILLGVVRRMGVQAVFIVPPSLTLNWAREIMKWTEHYGLFPAISIVPESTKAVYMGGWKSDFIICPDSMLTRPWVLNALTNVNPVLIAVDEASRFKDGNAQRTRALFGGELNGGRWPGLIADARHVVLMDGSPMPNRSFELWAPTFAMAPEVIEFMSQQDFGLRYCGAKMNDHFQWEFKGDSNSEELHKKLTESFMHIVPESALNHPERLRSIVFMNKDVRTPEMKTWEQKHLKRLNFSDLNEELSRGEIAAHRRELGLKKVDWTVSYVKERLEKGESILLFAWHRECVERLWNALAKFKPGMVMGGTDPVVREKLFAEFQAGTRQLLVMNIAAAGRGHNLQRADRCIFHEWSWSDETNKQAEKRASRRGNDKEFTRSDYICATGTMDEPVLNSVFRKTKAIRKVIGI